jgi:signal peptide peptidase SppA
MLDYIQNTVWALEANIMQRFADVLERHVNDIRLDSNEVARIVADSRSGGQERTYTVRGNVAIVPVSGVLAKHSRQVNGLSQPVGTSVENIHRDLTAAIKDDAVRAILLDVESPGGAVTGLPELANRIYDLRQKLPVWAYANDMMASGGYLVGSQAHRIFATEAAIVGSIGTYTTVIDASRAAENAGVRVHIVASGAAKGGALGAEVSEARLNVLRQVVNDTQAVFTGAVERGRNLTSEQLESVLDGRVLVGRSALSAGLVDGIQTLDATVAHLNELVRAVHGARQTRKQELTMSNSESAALAELRQAFPKDLEFAVRACERGLSVTEAKAEYADVLQARADAEREQLHERLQQAEQRAQQAEEAHRGNSAVSVANDNPAGNRDPVAQWNELKRAALANCNTPTERQQALSRLVADNQELHTAYLTAQNEGVDHYTGFKAVAAKNARI